MPEITFIAGRKQKQIPRGDELVDVAAGQPLPEAAGFRKLKAYIKAGLVIRLVDGVPDPLSRQRARQLGLTPYRRHEKKADKPAPVKKKASKKKASKKKASKKKASKKKAPPKKGQRRVTRREG
jgi:hypothetical protein